MAKFLPFDPLPWAIDKRERGARALRVKHLVVFTPLLTHCSPRSLFP